MKTIRKNASVRFLNGRARFLVFPLGLIATPCWSAAEEENPEGIVTVPNAMTLRIFPFMYIGDWISVGPSASDVARVKITGSMTMSGYFSGNGYRIHCYGACSPADCDWGSTAASFQGSTLKAVFEYGSKITTLTMNIADGVLHVHSAVTFSDGTGSNYQRDDTFRKVTGILGDWVNLDPASLGTTRVIIAGEGANFSVRGFADSNGSDIDWGQVPGKFELGSLVAVQEWGFVKKTMTINILEDGRLRVHSTNVYDGAFQYFDKDEYFVKPQFVRGDVNSDGTAQLADAVSLLQYLFVGGEDPACLKAADINDDGRVDITDPFFLFQYLFRGGEAPPAPKGVCGIDPTVDDLSCMKPDICP